jgi:hypothetical protein
MRRAAKSFGDALLEGIFGLSIKLNQSTPIARVCHRPVFVKSENFMDDDSANGEVCECHSAVGLEVAPFV